MMQTHLSLRHYILALCGIILLFLPSETWAASLSVSTCSGVPAYMVTTSVVVCVQNSILTAAGTIYSLIGIWMGPIVAGMFTLAVVMLGMRIAGGEQGAIRHAVPFIIKLAMVSGYTIFLSDIGGLAFSLMTVLANAAGGGSTPWGLIDNTIMSLFGYGPSVKLYQGLVGLVIASLFSGTIGVAVFLAGVAAILSLISSVGRVLFIYLGAFLVVGFMVAISPMFIPMIVFNTTDRYFKQWLNITLAAIIQPMFLFAVCSMFMSIFPSLLGNIYSVTGGNDFRPIWHWNKPLMSWVVPSDPKLQQYIDTQPDGDVRKRSAAVPSYVNPLLADAPNLNIYKVPSIDFGLVHVSKMQQLLVAFVALALFAMLIKTLVEITPQIAEDITASAIGLAGMRTPIEGAVNKAVSDSQSKLGTATAPSAKTGQNSKKPGGSPLSVKEWREQVGHRPNVGGK